MVTTDVALLVAVAAVVIALVSVGVTISVFVSQRRVQGAVSIFVGDERHNAFELMQSYLDEVVDLRGEVVEISERTEDNRDLLARCVSRVSTIRYDAFEEMGGHLSYSTALLDEVGDGVVLTSIHGRTDTRSYAKPIEAGESRHTLSVEERAAVDRALAAGWGEVVTVPVAEDPHDVDEEQAP